jgi:hypothetical protein
MSPRTSDPSKPPAGAYRKPRADVYTMLLFVAFVALVLGTVVLYLETQEYGPQPFGAAWPNSSTGIVPVVAAATGETAGSTGILPVLVVDAGQTPMAPGSCLGGAFLEA